MSRRRTGAIAAALSLLALGSPLIPAYGAQPTLPEIGSNQLEVQDDAINPELALAKEKLVIINKVVVTFWKLSKFKDKEIPQGLTSNNEDGRVNFSYYEKGASEFYTVNANGIVTWEGTSEVIDIKKIPELFSLATKIILDITKTESKDFDHAAIIQKLLTEVGDEVSSKKEDFDSIKEALSNIEDEVKKISLFYDSARQREENGDLEGAIKDYSKAIELSPDSQYILNSRGVAKYKNGDARGAIKDYTTALGIAPRDPLILMNRARAKDEIGDSRGAINDVDKALEINPYDPLAYLYRGIFKGELKDFRSALIDFNKALEIDPDNAVAYFFRGITKKVLQDLKGACEDWKKAAELGDEDDDALLVEKHCQ